MKCFLRAWWLVFAVEAACLSPYRAADRQMQTNQARAADVLLVIGERTCDGERSQLPAEYDLNHLVSSLSPMMGQPKINILRDASSQTLVRYLAANSRRPLLVIYTGHGQMQKWRSELCLRDGPVATEYLLAQVSKVRSSAMWLINACSSAFVDVRYASVPLSIVTVATTQFKTDPSRPSAAIDAFVKALAVGDSDKDGLITDDELFRQMQRYVVSDRQKNPSLRLHLRRQAAVPIPLFLTSPLARSLPWAFHVAADLVPEILPALRLHRDFLDDLSQPLPSALLRVAIESSQSSRALNDDHRLSKLARFTPFARLWLRVDSEQTVFDLREKRYVSPSEQVIAAQGGQVLEDSELGSFLYIEGIVGQMGRIVMGGKIWMLEHLMAVPCPRAQIGQCFVQLSDNSENSQGNKQ